MSLSHRAVIARPQQNTPSQNRFGFILVLICAALSLAVLSTVFTPVSIGTIPDSEVSFVGP